MSCTHPVIYTDKDGQYCLVCGARLNAEAVPTVETNENPPEAEKPLEAEIPPKRTMPLRRRLSPKRRSRRRRQRSPRNARRRRTNNAHI